MSDSPWSVHKFGGTCLADPERMRCAAELVRASGGARRAVVVSAMGGVTDALIETVQLAAAGDESWAPALDAVRERVLAAAEELLAEVAGGVAGEVVDAVRRGTADLAAVLKGVEVARSFAEQTLELVAGYGELWSAQLFCAHLRALGEDAAWADARDVLVVEHQITGPVVDWERSGGQWAEWLAAHPQPMLVITGYIARDQDGVPTTLKRNGSDYSASIFAALLGAGDLTIWTDVDGVMSADPRRVPEAVVIPELSYDEAMELAFFGAKVLHPHTMGPAMKHGIPIRIRNAFAPDAPGTLLHRGAATDGARRGAVKGFSSTAGLALLNVEGAGMIGVPGIASRLFTALQGVGVSVVMISQASSEHSICVAIPEAQANKARRAVRQAFAAELHHGQIQTVDTTGPFSVVAAVGDGMVETPGVAARFFNALSKGGANVRAIAQGSSERNISAVVDQADADRALRAVHAGFYLSDQTLALGVIGAGQIGQALLRQLEAEQVRLHERFHIALCLRGVARSQHMLLDEGGVALSEWSDRMAREGQPTDLEALADCVRAAPLPHAVLIDCTAEDRVASRYAGWLERGIHVITPNKKANSADFASYQRLGALARKHNAHYLYEATVGAGLPVITTLRDLIRTGDRVLRVEGVLSGTLSFLFNAFADGLPFSAVVGEARQRGYTEPDLRDDLSGTDVARKAVIVGREMGLPLELGDVAVESLVPPALAGVADPDEFVRRLADYDPAMSERQRAARDKGGVLRYVAVIDPEVGVDVGVRCYDRDHAFAGLTGADNVFAFTTERYREQPLLVRGPGAGPEVTAGGVFADLLRLASYLGASP